MVEQDLKTGSNREPWFSQEDSQRGTSESVRWRIASRPRVWRPPTDVYETEEALIVRVEIAGMRDTDFTISIDERLLSIRGVRPDLPERRAYHQLEIPFGEFISEVEIPCPVVVEQVEAIYRDGFLRISLPKSRPHQIHIE